MFPAVVEQSDAILSYFSYHTINKLPFCGLFIAYFSNFFVQQFHCLKQLPSTMLKSGIP